MTVAPDDAGERSSQEATDWLILLQEQPDDLDLRHRFEAWLAAGPQNAEAWAVTLHVSGMLSRLPPSHADLWDPFVAALRAAESNSRVKSRSSSKQPTSGWGGGHRRRLLLYVGAAAAVGLCYFVAPQAWLRLRADYTTGTAETRTVTLADGSTITLAPDSAVSVSLSRGKRQVDLLAGEAFFTVAHNPNRPFRVAIRHIVATDIGTAFDVRRRGDGALIAVQQGKVRIDYPNGSSAASETLDPQQTLRIRWSGTAMRGVRPSDEVAAWRQHQIVANDQPMREVVDQLRPYFAGKIIIAGAGLSRQQVTGVYNLNDPVEALHAIAAAHGASVRRIGPWMLVVSGD